MSGILRSVYPSISLISRRLVQASRVPSHILPAASTRATSVTLLSGFRTSQISTFSSENNHIAVSFNPFQRIASANLSSSVRKTLGSAVDDALVQVTPSGLIYVPAFHYRRLLTQAFGAGGWGLMPRGSTQTTADGSVASREYALYVQGCYVAQSRGEYHFNNRELSPALVSAADTVSEVIKAHALVLCARDLGIYEELADPAFAEAFRSQYCDLVPVQHESNKSKYMMWRRKDGSIDLPWVEMEPVGEGTTEGDSDANVTSASTDTASPPSTANPQVEAESANPMDQSPAAAAAAAPPAATPTPAASSPSPATTTKAGGSPYTIRDGMDSLPFWSDPAPQPESTNVSQNEAKPEPTPKSTPARKTAKKAALPVSGREQSLPSLLNNDDLAGEDDVEDEPRVNLASFDPEAIVPREWKKYQGKKFIEVLEDPAGRSYLHWVADKFKGNLRLAARTGLAYARSQGLYGSKSTNNGKGAGKVKAKDKASPP